MAFPQLLEQQQLPPPTFPPLLLRFSGFPADGFLGLHFGYGGQGGAAEAGSRRSGGDDFLQLFPAKFQFRK